MTVFTPNPDVGVDIGHCVTQLEREVGVGA